MAENYLNIFSANIIWSADYLNCKLWLLKWNI